MMFDIKYFCNKLFDVHLSIPIVRCGCFQDNSQSISRTIAVTFIDLLPELFIFYLGVKGLTLTREVPRKMRNKSYFLYIKPTFFILNDIFEFSFIGG